MSRVEHQTTRDMYRAVQVAYRTAIELGQSPVDRVARRLQVSPRVARQRIYRARRAGYPMEEHDGV